VRSPESMAQHRNGRAGVPSEEHKSRPWIKLQLTSAAAVDVSSDATASRCAHNIQGHYITGRSQCAARIARSVPTPPVRPVSTLQHQLPRPELASNRRAAAQDTHSS
jgi:hypothetical protein